MVFLFFVLLLSLTNVPSAQAYSISPSLIELEMSGPKSSATVQVKNPSNKDISISVYMKERKIDENAIETRADFDVKKNFLILPTNFTVKAKSVVAVRISYIGSKALSQEKAYRFIFANLTPVDIIKSKGAQATSVKGLLSYATSVYVSPKNVKPELNIKTSKNKKGQAGFLIENKGLKRAQLSNSKIEIRAANLKESEKYSAREFKELAVPILSGQTRFIPLPSKSKSKADSAIIEFSDWQ